MVRRLLLFQKNKAVPIQNMLLKFGGPKLLLMEEILLGIFKNKSLFLRKKSTNSLQKTASITFFSENFDSIQISCSWEKAVLFPTRRIANKNAEIWIQEVKKNGFGQQYEHGNGKWPFWGCIPYLKTGFSIAMLVHQRVILKYFSGFFRGNGFTNLNHL